MSWIIQRIDAIVDYTGVDDSSPGQSVGQKHSISRCNEGDRNTFRPAFRNHQILAGDSRSARFVETQADNPVRDNPLGLCHALGNSKFTH